MDYCVRKKDSNGIPYTTKQGMLCVFEDAKSAVQFYNTMPAHKQGQYEVVPCKVVVTFIT